VHTTSPVSVRIVGTNGQISLGKQYAGRQVMVEEQELGVWLVRTATVVPDNERWLHASTAAQDLSQALHWASQNAPSDAGLDTALRDLADDKNGKP
jgi:hypothetical protein